MPLPRRRMPDYLFDEIAERIAKGPVKFKLPVQLAEMAMWLTMQRMHWPASRTVLELGTIELTARGR